MCTDLSLLLLVDREEKIEVFSTLQNTSWIVAYFEHGVLFTQFIKAGVSDISTTLGINLFILYSINIHLYTHTALVLSHSKSFIK